MKRINFFLFSFLIVVIILSLFYGAVKVPIDDVGKILLNKIGGFDFEISKRNYTAIVYYIRLPRVLTGIIVGGALAICGCTMQSLLKNPIADSGIIGISSGASLGAVVAIALGVTSKSILAMPVFSSICALIISVMVYRIASIRGKSDALILVLSGIAVSSFVSAISSMILTNLMESQLKEYIFWSVGSLSGRRWEHFYLGVGPILLLSFILITYGKELNILLLGDDEAKTLGINTERLRKKILGITAILTAISVCIAGNIGFIGLIVPHILRRIIGSDNRELLKTSFLAGAFFLVLSDFIARVIFIPKEISVGIITALIGAPYFIYLIVKIRKEARGL